MAKLTPRQRAYIRKRTTAHSPDPSEEMGELNIVPFLDIVVNLIIFLLATVQSVLAIAQLDAQLPTLGRRVGRSASDSDSSTLNLSVTITAEGIIVSGSGGKLAPGCTQTQSGRVITVPSRNGVLEWSTEVRAGSGRDATITSQVGPTSTALTECVQRVHERFPDESQVILTADPEIEFENVVGAMDALRGPGPEPLFPDVMLSAGVR
ncbi:MAG: ExbD/TolR family protein [Sandaracinaceae bacterium]